MIGEDEKTYHALKAQIEKLKEELKLLEDAKGDAGEDAEEDTREEAEGGDESPAASQIKAQLYRTDLPEDSTIKRETAETLWIHSPGGDELPTITLTQN